MPHNQRRHRKVDLFSDEGRDLVVSMLKSKRTYADIRAALLEATGEEISDSSLSRLWKNLEKQRLAVESELKSRREKVDLLLAIAKEKPNQETDEYIKDMIEAGLVFSQRDFTEVDPTKLMREQRMRAKLELENKKLEAQIAKNKAGESAMQAAGGANVSPARIYHHVAENILKTLRGYAEFRPLLSKFSANIAKRLSNEAERFDLAEVTDAR